MGAILLVPFLCPVHPRRLFIERLSTYDAPEWRMPVNGLSLLVHFGVRTRLRIATAGLLTGFGIVSMHYVGMAAIRGNCIITYDPFGVLVATGLAMTASILAFERAYHRRTLGLTFIGAITLGLTITAMHYTAMLSTTFALGAGVDVASEPSLSSGGLALIASLVACFS